MTPLDRLAKARSQAEFRKDIPVILVVILMLLVGLLI